MRRLFAYSSNFSTFSPWTFISPVLPIRLFIPEDLIVSDISKQESDIVTGERIGSKV